MDQRGDIEDIRAFNRFYTRRIGILEEKLLASPFTLAEVRVLYEISAGGASTASHIRDTLGLDAGYLSRIVKKFEAQGLVERTPSAADSRSSVLSLTGAGKSAFAPLDQGAAREIARLLDALSQPDRMRLVNAMVVIRRVLGDSPGSAARQTGLRAHRPGDIGWAIERHGALYADEFGWNEEFEGLVAKILGGFLESHDPVRERCWIAEADGERAGCVFLVQDDKQAESARLRCLLVDPAARGLGLGGQLVEACLDFARSAGYRRMVLWTNDVLVSARRIYQAAGFELLDETPHHSFGHDLVGQTWARSL